MKTVGWNILILSFAFLASAQVPKECSAPSEYPHTRLNKKYTSRQKYAVGEKVYYNCAEDFIPSSGIRVVQCIGGKWTKLTLKCEKKSCGNAGDLPNGQFQYEGNSFLGEKVYAVCNEGYTLKGLNYMICKKSGWTGEFPSCEEGAVTCFTPAVANSVRRGDNVSVHWVGDSMTFTCSEGFQLDGAQQITCGPDGQWEPQPPRCLPSPDDKATGGCGVPVTTKNSNANLADKYITMTSFASGDKVHYVCNVGYIQAGGSRLRRCIEGKWTPLLLKCERKACGSAGEILNGQFTYTGVEFGDTATAVCDEGHQLVGRATRHCMSNGWDGRVPVCEAVGCAEPPEVTNAEMEGRQEPPYTYRSVVRYHCRVGTLIGQREIWCTKDGTWSTSAPKCKEITCSSPIVPSAYWTGAHNELHQYRDTITIECNPGYRRFGPSTVTCGSDGRWFPTLPKCTRISHGTY
ncbi:complement receptor type 1-like [Siniperca chuatsi]|uniref:complement receptor type 1-like n=1 Tax=Siniperca chuatsi TaxID=119488 RepID=UPI001CE1657E|nr:complement receptor type 1-like [Siniperca chuatsi]